jgi:hypothetical protein
MADASVVDLDTNLVSSRRLNFDIFDSKVLARFPRNGRLVFDLVFACSCTAIQGVLDTQKRTLQVIVCNSMLALEIAL